MEKKLVWALELIQKAGGRPFLVGGFVRDQLLSRPSKDVDVEVFGLSLDQLQEVLEDLGSVDLVGKSFGVLKLHGLDVDFSVPRRDNKVADGHKGFAVTCDPFMSVEQAALRRDLTMNSMSMEFTGKVAGKPQFKLHDPFGGQKDMRDCVLRTTDPATFLEDPLRAMRVAQFVSRFGFKADAVLVDLCRKADLSQLPGERLFTEFQKLLKGDHPSDALDFMWSARMFRFFPELHVLEGCAQGSEHPEGDVLVHTAMVLDALRSHGAEEHVMWAGLCHDMGKPAVREVSEDRVRFFGHDKEGVAPARAFLQRLRAPLALEEKVCCLVEHHMAVWHFFPKAGRSAFLRLARKLSQSGTCMADLMVLCQGDHEGRAVSEPERLRETMEWFRGMVEKLDVRVKAQEDVVMGRHLVARGLKPGPQFGKVLAACRELQFEQGLTDPDEILDHVLRED